MLQKDLASQVDMTPTSVGQILSGKQRPSAEALAALCRALRVHPSWVLLGLEPRYLEDSATDLAPARVPVLGVEQWLAEQREVTPDERAWLRAVPWTQPHVRQPDHVYQMALLTYRQIQPRSHP